MNEIITEKIIEDILCSDKSILSEILNVNASDLSLVARQKILVSGKLDMLYLCKNELLLIELKAVVFYPDTIKQINAYAEDLIKLQRQNRLINSGIKKIIIVTGAKQEDFKKCAEENILLLTYKPEFVFSRYYENFKELSHFLTIQSGDFGVVRIALIKSTLYLLAQGKRISEICLIEKKSNNTIKNRLSIAIQLNLVVKYKHDFFLTDFGNDFLSIGDNKIDDRLNEAQLEALSEYVKGNPFYSSITYTIFSMIETVFVLAKNIYPVPKNNVEEYFVKSVGKDQTWKTSKARETATYIFSNYACELGFLAKVNNEFYITPKGINAILLLQLNRSIKLIETQK